MKVLLPRIFFGGLVTLALLAEANLCPVTNTYVPVAPKRGSGFDGNAWLVCVAHCKRYRDKAKDAYDTRPETTSEVATYRLLCDMWVAIESLKDAQNKLAQYSRSL